MVDAGLVVVEIRDTRKGGRGRAGEEEEHRSVIEEVAWAGDGELGRSRKLEANGLAVALGAEAETPGLDVDAAIPEAVGRWR